MQFEWWYLAFLMPILIYAGLFIIVWDHREKRMAKWLIVLSVMALPWMATSLLSLFTTGQSAKLFLLQVGHAGSGYITVIWLMLIFDFIGWENYLNRRVVMILSIIPTLGIFLAISFPHHQLYWYDFTLNEFNTLSFKRGLLLHFRNFYFYLIVIFLTIILLVRAVQTTGRLRHQVLVVATAPIPILITHIAVISGLSQGIDIVTFGFGVTGIILTVGTLGYDILTIVPIGRRQVFDQNKVGMIILDAKHAILDINERARNVLGVTSTKVLGTSLFKYLDPSLTDNIQEIYQISAVTEYQAEICNRGHYYDVRVTPILNGYQEVIGRTIMLYEVTQHKEMALSLTKSEQSAREFQLHLQNLHQIRAELADYDTLDEIYENAIIIGLNKLGFDRMGLFLIQDNHVLGTFGTDPTGAVRDERDYRSEMTEHTWMQKVLESDDFVFLWSDSEIMDYDQGIGHGWKAVAAFWDGSHPIGFLAVDNHLTNYPPRSYETQLLAIYGNILAHIIARKRAEIQQRLLIKELEAFAHTVAHDLKNPLSIIQGFAAVMQETDEKSPAEIDQFTNITFSTSQKMFSIIDELLLLAEIRNRTTLPVGKLDTGRIIQGVMYRLENLIVSTQAIINLPTTWDCAIGYEPWVEQVWINYVSNALKYGGSPPVITLGSERLPNHLVRFWIKDNGSGIAEKDLSRLFGEFSRLNETSVSGHGIGLSIVKRIIEKLGGEVGVTSQYGQGSTFYFILSENPPQTSQNDVA